MSDFKLVKWYLDAADNKGNVFIGYYASLHWKKITLHGYQLFYRSPEGGTKTWGDFSKQPTPVVKNNNQIVWQPKYLSASWESSENTIDEVLFSSECGYINWKCLQPKAKAKIQLPTYSFEGLGYTELIEITVPIWNLPFKTLYWGRALSKNHCLSWIKWDGEKEKSLIWHNGKRSNNLTITDDIIGGSDFKLKLRESISLRQGKLKSTVFKSFGKITKLLPRTTFLADEHKWYCQGILESNSGSEPAIIIYEKVLW